MDELVLYAIVSAEAVALSKGSRGKMAAQTGHAFCNSLIGALRDFPERALEYINSPATPKMVLVASEADIRSMLENYKDTHGTALVIDAGRTVFPEPTLTALGIGPILKSEREEILKNLRPWQ